MPIIYCKRCRTGYGSAGDIPAVCPSCEQLTAWTTMAPTPRVYRLSKDDVSFLRSIRIAVDPSDCFPQETDTP